MKRFIFILFLIVFIFSGCSPSLGALPVVVNQDSHSTFSGGYYIATITCEILNHGQSGQIAVTAALRFEGQDSYWNKSTIVYIEAGEIKTMEFEYEFDKPRRFYYYFDVQPLE